jgi:hypothetical protein
MLDKVKENPKTLYFCLIGRHRVSKMLRTLESIIGCVFPVSVINNYLRDICWIFRKMRDHFPKDDEIQ